MEKSLYEVWLGFWQSWFPTAFANSDWMAFIAVVCTVATFLSFVYAFCWAIGIHKRRK